MIGILRQVDLILACVFLDAFGVVRERTEEELY